MTHTSMLSQLLQKVDIDLKTAVDFVKNLQLLMKSRRDVSRFAILAFFKAKFLEFGFFLRAFGLQNFVWLFGFFLAFFETKHK